MTGFICLVYFAIRTGKFFITRIPALVAAKLAGQDTSVDYFSVHAACAPSIFRGPSPFGGLRVERMGLGKGSLTDSMIW